MTRAMRTAVWYLVGLSLVGCGGPRSHPAGAGREPFTELGIAIGPPDATGTFHFSFCGQRADAPLADAPVVQRIIVSPAGEKVTSSYNGASSNCVWINESGVASRTEWKYSSSPAGSKISGVCPPLRSDLTYEILVSGSGSGSLLFRITEQGTGAAVKSTCPESVPTPNKP